MSDIGTAPDPALSMFQLLDPTVHADPYPFFAKLRDRAPVHWDGFMHTWVVSRYADVQTVLLRFSADRTPDVAAMEKLGLPRLGPVADLMSRQMLFRDPPTHTRLRKLCSAAFTPRRVEAMEDQIADVADRLIDQVAGSGRMDVIADFAEPFPAIVTARLLGLPVEDHRQLKAWSADFAEMLGNFQHNPDRVRGVLRTVDEMGEYFRAAVRAQIAGERRGMIGSLIEARVDGARLDEEEIVANAIVTMVGGQETTTNLIGNGMLTLIRQPERMEELRHTPTILHAAIEELLRYESPSQHTARIAREDITLGGQCIRKGSAVMAVMAAGNRDPERFPDPDRLDFARPDNRHLAFGWAAHFCFGAPLARIEGRIAFAVLLRRLADIALTDAPLVWRTNSGLRGLKALPVTFREAGRA